MNSINLAGRLTAKPELKYTEKDKRAIARFSVAVNNGTDNADFFNVTAFDKQAENLVKYTDKGTMVAISGRLTTSSYEKDGVKVNTVQVVASNITFCNSKEK
jgi:single-strand DNA-binding protein